MSSSSNTSQITVPLTSKGMSSTGMPRVTKATPSIKPHQSPSAESTQNLSSKDQPGKPHFLQLADKVCGEELVRRLEDCGLPVYSSHHSPLEFLYIATVEALRRFQQKKLEGILDGEYYISRMVRGCVPPAKSFRDLFELEVGVLMEKCSQDLKLWCYHVVSYRMMVSPPRSSGLGVVRHVLQCAMPSESNPEPLFGFLLFFSFLLCLVQSLAK